MPIWSGHRSERSRDHRASPSAQQGANSFLRNLIHGHSERASIPSIGTTRNPHLLLILASHGLPARQEGQPRALSPSYEEQWQHQTASFVAIDVRRSCGFRRRSACRRSGIPGRRSFAGRESGDECRRIRKPRRDGVLWCNCHASTDRGSFGGRNLSIFVREAWTLFFPFSVQNASARFARRTGAQLSCHRRTNRGSIAVNGTGGASSKGPVCFRVGSSCLGLQHRFMHVALGLAYDRPLRFALQCGWPIRDRYDNRHLFWPLAVEVP